MQDDLTQWERQHLQGDDTCEVRVHTDGCVMWHRQNCRWGAKDGALSIGTVAGVPYAAFETAFDAEGRHDGRTVLFCGRCLVYRPRTADAPAAAGTS